MTETFDVIPFRDSQPARHAGIAVALVLAGMLAGCAAPQTGADISDPYEAQNRAVHADNKALDQVLFGGGGREGVVPTIPKPVAQGLSNVTANLAAPSNVVNGILQGRTDTVVANTFRFLINSTLGIGGIFDPATAIGIARDDTDFGETLYVWGVAEGAYLEVPVLGPSTERDLAGMAVDLALNPANFILDRPESGIATGMKLGAKVGDRQRYSDAVESILYDSADSYAQARLLYLQNRRFELGQEEQTYDPFGDPYAQ